MKKKLIKIGLSTALVIIFLASPLNAGAAGGGASEVTQIAQMGADILERGYAYTRQGYEFDQQIKQYEKQVEQYENQFISYKNMLQNIGKLPQQQWDQFSQSVLELKKIINYGEGINFAASSYDADFRSLFKGYDKYLTEAKGGHLDFQAQYKQLRISTRDSINGALKSLGLQVSDIQSDEATMKQLQNLSQSATGQLGAIQAANAIAVHQTHALKKLQQTIMLQANMQAQFMLAQNEKETMKQAGKDTFMSKRVMINPNDDVPVP